jgi:hypothetical protein
VSVLTLQQPEHARRNCGFSERKRSAGRLWKWARENSYESVGEHSVQREVAQPSLSTVSLLSIPPIFNRPESSVGPQCITLPLSGLSHAPSGMMRRSRRRSSRTKTTHEQDGQRNQRVSLPDDVTSVTPVALHNGQGGGGVSSSVAAHGGIMFPLSSRPGLEMPPHTPRTGSGRAADWWPGP